MRDLNAVNVAGYIQSYVNRTALPLVRSFDVEQSAATAATPTTIETDVCLVTGDLAKDRCDTMAEMNGQMDPKLTQFISVSSSSSSSPPSIGRLRYQQ